MAAAEAPAQARADAVVEEFLIARGGPYWDLQRRLGLLHERALHAGRRAALLVAIAWGVPLVLSLAAGRALGPPAAHPFLLDPVAWARFFVAIAVFVLMEGMVEQRLRLLLRQFAQAPLVPPAEMPKAAAAVARSLERRDAPLAEMVILALAAAISVWALAQHAGDTALSWLAADTPDGARLTTAGWWAGLVSNPLFWFLLLRWLWRYLVWALLLRDLARLDLRLVATHPDGMGGLAFVGRYPNVFSAFVFALSGVLAAAIARALLSGQLEIGTFPVVMGVWLAVVFLLFALPLAAFGPPLRRLKEATLLACAAGATRHQRAVEREVLGRNLAAADAGDAAPPSDLPDTSKLYAAVGKLTTWPVSKSVLLPLGAAALLPLGAAGATRMPLKDVIKIAKGLLL